MKKYACTTLFVLALAPVSPAWPQTKGGGSTLISTISGEVEKWGKVMKERVMRAQ